MNSISPFALQVDFPTGAISAPRKLTQRRLSDMRKMYFDAQAADHIIQREGDRLIYEVYAAELPEAEGLVLYCTTVIHPGKVGAEFHMTKGHYHQKRDRAEIYLGLAGEGVLLLQREDGTVSSVPMKAGSAAYVPPYWAHRTVNTGTTPFIFFAAWPGDAGHDYGTIERDGFAKILVERDGQATLIANPVSKS
ncbi:MAG: glucose-6-phosphate isomerase [Aggregatilineales bacterium]